MMFLQYAILGVWGVTLPTFLLAPPHEGGLSLSGQQVGLLFATFAIAAMGTPFVVGLLADRFFASQRLYAALHLLGAVFLTFLFAAVVDERTEDWPFIDRIPPPSTLGNRNDVSFPRLLMLFLAYAACYMPSLTLSNAISFRNLPHMIRQYGHVRVFGTIGWLASGVFVGMMLPSVSALPLLYGAAGSLLLGLYAFTLPHTPPAHVGKSLAELFGVPAIKMFAHRSFRVFVITSFVITLVTAFHNTYLNRYLVDLGVKNAAAWQTTGQLTEIVCILALPWMRMRIGLKRTLFIGLAASTVRFGIYAAGNVPWLIAVGIPLQGVCFGFYFVAAMLFIDRHAPRDLRASAQGLLAICTSGVGAFAGNWIAGIAVDGYRGPNGVAWPAVWALPAIGSLFAAAYFAWQFREPVTESTPKVVTG